MGENKKKPTIEFKNSETINILNSDLQDPTDQSNQTVNVKLWQEVNTKENLLLCYYCEIPMRQNAQ